MNAPTPTVIRIFEEHGMKPPDTWPRWRVPGFQPVEADITDLQPLCDFLGAKDYECLGYAILGPEALSTALLDELRDKYPSGAEPKWFGVRESIQRLLRSAREAGAIHYKWDDSLVVSDRVKLSIWFPKAIDKRMRHAAVDQGMSLSDFATDAVEAAVFRHETTKRSQESDKGESR